MYVLLRFRYNITTLERYIDKSTRPRQICNFGIPVSDFLFSSTTSPMFSFSHKPARSERPNLRSCKVQKQNDGRSILIELEHPFF